MFVNFHLKTCPSTICSKNEAYLLAIPVLQENQLTRHMRGKYLDVKSPIQSLY